MTARSSCRGHATYWDGECWRYSDDGSKQSGWGGAVRRCAHCGLNPEGSVMEDAPDPCLGHLPGVESACCGHGDRELVYVRFTNGVVLKGFVLEHPDDPPLLNVVETTDD